jgi:hypothetical protein
MADITTFPTIRNVLYAGNNIQGRKASGTIKAGMVVCPAATGVEKVMIACVAGAGQAPEGVALYDAADGEWFAMAGPGCEIYVANTDGVSVTADVGDYAIPDDNAVGGCVSPLAPGAITAGIVYSPIGRFTTDMAANATGRILINPIVINVAVS